MARLINEHTCIADVMQGKRNLPTKIWIEEYATTWRVSAKHIGWAMPMAEQWRYTKKECKRIEDVINQFINDFEKHWGNDETKAERI